jgi:hypothetical protein
MVLSMTLRILVRPHPASGKPAIHLPPGSPMPVRSFFSPHNAEDFKVSVAAVEGWTSKSLCRNGELKID